MSFFSTRISTMRDMQSDWYAKWKKKFNFPDTLHRKSWELAVVCETLDSNGFLDLQDSNGVGFGVGSEFLPSYFAGRGCKILATDLLQSGWNKTTSKFYEINRAAGVEAKVVDMNWILGESGFGSVQENSYDFSWSVCSMDHCGSSWLTKRFLLNQMNCLKVGGIAVHTAEYSIDLGLPNSGTTSWLNWTDIEDIRVMSEKIGYSLAPMDWFLGDSVEDHIIDPPPYKGRVHLKAEISGGRWGTCIVFALKKTKDVNFWLSGKEPEARKKISSIS